MSHLEAEYQEFLERHHVPEVVTEMLVELCKARPTDVVSFMTQYLLHRGRSIISGAGDDSSSAAISSSSSSSSSSVSSSSSGLPPGAGSTSGGQGDRQFSNGVAGARAEEDDDSGYDSKVADMLRRRYSTTTTRRYAISAEPMNDETGPAGAGGSGSDVSNNNMAPAGVAVGASRQKDPAQRGRLERALKTNGLFSHLEESERNALFDAMEERRILAGEVIIRQGDQGDNFYVVDSGECSVFVAKPHLAHNDPLGEKVGHVKAGGSFGELALMYGTTRAASVRADTDCTLWVLDRKTYRTIMMRTMMQKREMYEKLLGNVPVLAELEPYERAKIADAVTSCTFRDGETIVREGDSGEDFFIIIEGQARVLQSHGAEQHELARLGPSDYFGEIALLTDQPRLATVVAIGTVKCTRLDRAAFNRVLGPVEALLRRNMARYTKFVSSKI